MRVCTVERPSRESGGWGRRGFGQLAFDFRGCLSFWIAGELQDRDLGTAVAAGACALLLGFATLKRRVYLVAQIKSLQSASASTDLPTDT
jgi:hypothetical protein